MFLGFRCLLVHYPLSSHISASLACRKGQTYHTPLLVGTNHTQVYTFILSLVGTNINLAWMILCVTYIRFRSACKTYNIAGVKEAQHPLQPFLAYWGLFWSGFSGIISYPLLI